MAMRTIAALLLIAGLIASPQFLPAQPAHACYCRPSGPEGAVAGAQIVILGTVVQIDQIEDQDIEIFSHRYDLTIDVGEYLKGSGEDPVIVRDFSLQESACSAFAPDSVGHQYLLFLTTDKEAQLRTSYCAGSGRVENSEQRQEILAEIRQIVSEQEQPTGPPTLTTTSSEPQLPAAGSGLRDEPLLPIAVAVAGVIGLIGAGLLLGVRRLRSG